MNQEDLRREGTVKFTKLLETSGQYFSERVRKHGPTSKGVDWGSREGQELRFKQLLKCCHNINGCSVNDYGCGYGALLDYMTARGYQGDYQGFDISEEMIVRAKEIHKGLEDRVSFTTDEASLTVADYTLVSGIFNLKQDADADEWTRYMLYTLDKIAKLNRKGFVLNVLSNYCDPDARSDDLYYADPLLLFDYCKKNYSDYLALYHDYPLPDFTILVKKEN